MSTGNVSAKTDIITPQQFHKNYYDYCDHLSEQHASMANLMAARHVQMIIFIRNWATVPPTEPETRVEIASIIYDRSAIRTESTAMNAAMNLA